MKLYLLGHEYRYAMEQIMLILFPGQKPEYPAAPPAADEAAAWSRLSRGPAWITGTARLQWEGRTASASARVAVSALEGQGQVVADRLLQRVLKQSFYKAAVELLGEKPAWGALTGIRPARLASKALASGDSEQAVRRQFRRTYFVSPERTELALAAARASLAAQASLRPDELSLYVGVPFCHSRCAYCSFVSADVQRSLKLVEPYLDALEAEMEGAGRLVERAGAAVRTVYLGGGTPTTLSAGELDRLLTGLERSFDLSRCTEFTVEAGRPDTITADKLAVIAAHGADRVSVNPQSMRPEVLEAIGRSHTPEDILRAYETVRQAGNFVVNMDLIAGLPRDDAAGFRFSLDQVLDLAPEHVTVHTLALKKGARLMLERQGLPDGREAAAMLDYAWDRLSRAGYVPYYLYRQKYMSGALENVGWCRPGTEGLYNICIMEELHTILALGGGGSTKLVDAAAGRVRRIMNPKYPYEYIQNVPRLLEEKEALVDFQRRLMAGQG